VKENQEKDKIGSNPDKNEKRGKAGKILKQLRVHFHKWSLDNPTMGDVNHFQRFRERGKRRRTPETAKPTGPSIYHEDEKVTRADVETNTKELLTHTEKSSEEVSNTVVLGTESGGHDEKQGVPDPGDSAESRPLPSQGIHTGSSLDSVDEGFIATAYHNVQENLKLTVEEHVILKEPASSTRTLSSLQHLAKDFSFGDQFFNDKHTEAENEKTTVETEAESMVSVTIQQDTSAIPPMKTSMIDLTSKPDSPKVQRPLPVTTTTITTTTTLPPPPQPQQSTTDSILIKHIGELEQIMTNLIQDNKHLKEMLDSHGSRNKWRISIYLSRDLPEADMKEILYQRIWETNSYQTNEITRIYTKDHLEHLDHHKYRLHLLHLYPPTRKKPLSEEDRPATPEPAWSILSSDLPVPMNNWASALASTYAPPPENSLLAQTGNMAIFMEWYCKKQGITEFKQKDLEGPAFKIVKVFHPNVIHLQYQTEECYKLLTDKVDDSLIRYNVSKPLPLGGQPGQMKKIVLHIADLKEYIIAKMDFKYLYPSDFEDLYLLNLQGHLNHLPPKDKKTLTTAINLWTRNLVIKQRVEDFQLGIKSYQTQLNLTKPRWDATGFEYKHDFTIIESPRFVTFRDKYGVQMIIWFNEIHKFSDNTLHQIDEALDYRVKEFKVNRMNLSLNTRFYIRKDVDRSKEFMFAIQKWLKTRRIFCNLESFVGRRSELVDIEKVAVCFSLRSLKPKRTIKSRAKRSSKNLIRTLFHYACFFIHCEKYSAILLNKLPLKEKDTRSFTIPCQVLDKHKKAEDLAVYHLSRFKNPHIEVLTRRKNADKFSDEHLMVLKSKFNNDEPWYADFVNYIVGKVVPPNWTFEKRKRFFLQVKTYFWRIVIRELPMDIIVLQLRQRRSRNISSRNEMPQNNIQALPTNDARVVVKFLRSLFARFGVPKALISDRGTHFCKSQLEKLYKDMVAIKRILERSVGYNPKGERIPRKGQNQIKTKQKREAWRSREKSKAVTEPDNSLSMGDEHLDTIPATELDEFTKSNVENLIPIPSESEGIPEHKCDVPSHDNSPPLDVSKDQFENFSESNEEFSSINDDSFSIDDIDYVEASTPNSKLVSSEVMEIVIPEVGGIDDDILLTIKDDILREKLLNVNFLIAKIEALNANPTPSFDCKTKSSSTSLNSLWRRLIPLIILYPSLKFSALMLKRLVVAVQLLILIFLFRSMKISMTIMLKRSDFYEFTDELIPFISPPEYDCFLFKVEPNSRDFTKDVVEDISLTKYPQVLNALPTHPTL
nr:hypothetical protein [Tanacetum cinerariifolium]